MTDRELLVAGAAELVLLGSMRHVAREHADDYFASCTAEDCVRPRELADGLRRLASERQDVSS